MVKKVGNSILTTSGLAGSLLSGASSATTSSCRKGSEGRNVPGAHGPGGGFVSLARDESRGARVEGLVEEAVEVREGVERLSEEGKRHV